MGWSKDHGTIAKVNADYAKAQGDIAKQEANKVEQFIEDNKTNWLPAVATVALRNSTYPNPQHGDTVRVTGEAKTYRYVSPTGWVITDIYDASAIDQVAKQLAQTAQKIPTTANGTDILRILNPYGNYQNIHPKVVKITGGFLGYSYWMAYTPYPNGDTKKENPCIVASNDKLNWVVPSFIPNNGLLEDWPGASTSNANHYNNDTHLVYRSDLRQLEIWYRTANATTKVVNLKRRILKNDQSLSEVEVIFTGTQDSNDHICPSVIFDDNKYKLLSVQASGGWRINYTEISADLTTWSARTRCEFDGLDSTWFLWHPDFIKTDLGYELIVQAWRTGQSNNTSDLYYAKSTDLINWSELNMILAKSKELKKFDNAGIYRSTILKENGIYYVFYSAIDNLGNRAMSLSYSDNIYTLDGWKGNKFNLNPVYQKWEDYNVFPGDFVSTVGVTRFYKEVNELQMHNGTRFVPISQNGMGVILVAKTVSQALTNGTEAIVNFDANRENTEGYFANGTTFTAPYPGKYRFTLTLQVQGLTAGDFVEIALNNGGIKHYLERVYVNGAVHLCNLSKIISLSKGGIITVGVKQSGTASSASISQYELMCNMQIERI